MLKRRLAYVLLCLGLGSAAGLLGPRPTVAVLAQTVATDTLLPGTSYITNIYEDNPFINVRIGPNTAAYDTCGSLLFGEAAIALGTTPLVDWVQIEYPSCPGGVGWVYADYVALSGALRVVETPPPPTLAAFTLDPTLVAAFQTEPTATRLSTFTPPPPLVRPTFTEAAGPIGSFPTGAAILAAAILGGLVLAASFMGRR